MARAPRLPGCQPPAAVGFPAGQPWVPGRAAGYGTRDPCVAMLGGVVRIKQARLRFSPSRFPALRSDGSLAAARLCHAHWRWRSARILQPHPRHQENFIAVLLQGELRELWRYRQVFPYRVQQIVPQRRQLRGRYFHSVLPDGRLHPFPGYSTGARPAPAAVFPQQAKHEPTPGD